MIRVCVSVHRLHFELCTLCACPVSQLGLLISKSVQEKGVECEGARKTKLANTHKTTHSNMRHYMHII
jgi:hypothetical protein